MAYHFIKIKLKNWEHPQWYFKPESVEDINDFFDTVIRGEIGDGARDFIDNFCRMGHATTAWHKGVSAMSAVDGGISWLETSLRLENKTYRDRIGSLLEGKEPLFANGVQWLDMSCVDEVLEEVERNDLVFPAKYTIDEVRYMQWGLPGNRGRHWYAKIGNMDIRDKNGNMKWDSEEDARIAAEWFLANKLNK